MQTLKTNCCHGLVVMAMHNNKSGEGWTGRCFHLGTNKKVFDAGVFAIYQALKIFGAGEPRRSFTVFSDSQSAIQRALTDALGSRQQRVRAIIEVCAHLVSRGSEITLRWVPAHKGVKGSEFADGLAREVAAGPSHSVQGRSGADQFPTPHEGPSRSGPGRPLSGSPLICAQSEYAALQVVRDYAVRLCARPGSPWLGVTTSCFRAVPLSGPSSMAERPDPKDWGRASAGDATAGSGRCATTCSQSAEGGPLDQDAVEKD